MIKKFESFVNTTEYICPLCLNRYMESNYIHNVKESINFKISSLQICVPLKGCINACKSCIARISGDASIFTDKSRNIGFDDNYFDKLKEIKNHGCKSMVITSDKGEPMQNKFFMGRIGSFNKKLNNWFDIEIQTTGVLLDDNNLSFLKNNVGVNVISVSVFDIFDNENNMDIINVKEKVKFDLNNLCRKIKEYNFTLRLSINLVKAYNQHPISELFDRIKQLNPDQVTIKNLWHTDEENAINKWIKSNKASSNMIDEICQYMDENGGNKVSSYRYNFNGKSVWLVDNCMLGNYLILRPDAELYRSWDATSPIEL